MADYSFIASTSGSVVVTISAATEEDARRYFDNNVHQHVQAPAWRLCKFEDFQTDHLEQILDVVKEEE